MWVTALLIYYISTYNKQIEPALDNFKIKNKNVVAWKGGLKNFKDSLGFKESSSNWDAWKSKGGYMGKYQIGKIALIDISSKDINLFGKKFNGDDADAFISKFKIYRSATFTPEQQERALEILLLANKKYLGELYIQDIIGTVIDGITITESGLLAAAHLVGANRIKKCKCITDIKQLNKRCKDGNGIHAIEYAKQFSGFDLKDLKNNFKNGKICKTSFTV
jgi:hypothetical protein